MLLLLLLSGLFFLLPSDKLQRCSLNSRRGSNGLILGRYLRQLSPIARPRKRPAAGEKVVEISVIVRAQSRKAWIIDVRAADVRR